MTISWLMVNIIGKFNPLTKPTSEENSFCKWSYIHISTLSLFLMRAIWWAPYLAVRNFSLSFSQTGLILKLTVLLGVPGWDLPFRLLLVFPGWCWWWDSFKGSSIILYLKEEKIQLIISICNFMIFNYQPEIEKWMIWLFCLTAHSWPFK